MSEAGPSATDPEADAGGDPGGAAEPGYTEWRCADCGHGHPKNNPPCDRCGLMQLEKTRVTAADFDGEVEPPSLLDEARDRPYLTAAAAVTLLAVVAVVLAWPFTVHSPVGDDIYGPVAAEAPDEEGPLTAGELRHRLDGELATTSMWWRGNWLEVNYATTATSRSTFVAEVRHVVDSYAAYVAAGGDAERLQVVVRVEGDRAGSFYVEREWVAGGESDDVVTRVLGTIDD